MSTLWQALEWDPKVKGLLRTLVALKVCVSARRACGVFARARARPSARPPASVLVSWEAPPLPSESLLLPCLVPTKSSWEAPPLPSKSLLLPCLVPT